MKIRNGFVSNSSSSSFVLYGIEVSTEQLHKLMIERLGEEKANELLEDGCYYTIADEVFNEEENFEIIYTDIGIFFGRDPFNVGDNETGKEFRDKVEKFAKEVFGEDECFEINEVIGG